MSAPDQTTEWWLHRIMCDQWCPALHTQRGVMQLFRPHREQRCWLARLSLRSRPPRS